MGKNKNYLLKCIECGEGFFTKGERDFYNSKGLNMPKRCKSCRDKKKIWYEQKHKEKEMLEKQKELEDIILSLPYKQISKAEIILKDPSSILFIIGNGFDLMHGVPSNYYNFRDSMGRQNELRNALEIYIKKEDLWADFEESLAYLDDEAMLGTANDWMDIFDVKDEFDEEFSAADFFMAAETTVAPAQTIERELPKQFREWICTLKPNVSGKPLEGIINDQSAFINFNYTEFLEEVYCVPKKNIWYIHGDRRDQRKELIIGHASGSEYEIDNNSSECISDRLRMKSQTAYDLHETTGYYLSSYYSSTTKKSNDVIKANKERFISLSKKDTVVVIGHSLSAVDYPYFKEIISNNQNYANIKWYISWHSADTFKRINAFADTMGIQPKQIELFRV